MKRTTRIGLFILLFTVALGLLTVLAHSENVSASSRGINDYFKFQPLEVVSEGSLVSSNAQRPAMAMSGDDIYLVWNDDGDRNLTETPPYILFTKSTDGGESWSKEKLLLDYNTLTYYLAADGDSVALSWFQDDSIKFMCSEDRGETWGDPVTVVSDPEPHPYFSMTASDDRFMIAWFYHDIEHSTYLISCAYTDDNGESWDESHVGEVDSCYDLWIDASGDHAYVIFNGYDNEYVVFAAASSNHGAGFSMPVEIHDSGDSISEPRISCTDDGHVYAIWHEHYSFGKKIYYSFSRDEGKSGSWSRGDFLDYIGSIAVSSISAERVGDEYHVYGSWTDSLYSNSDIEFARTTDEENWTELTGINVPHEARYPSLVSTNQGEIYIACEMKNPPSDLSRKDVFLNHSLDYGESWEEGKVLSDRLFDGNSYRPAIYADGDKVYFSWREDGNLSEFENGNDEDILFRYRDGDYWSDITVLSLDEEDRVSDFPTVGADGDSVYVAWVEDGNVSGSGWDKDVMLRYSSDGGENWGDIQVISDDENDGVSGYPKLAVSGSTCYLSWVDHGDIDNSGEDIDIFLRVIEDGTPGEEIILVSEGCDKNSIEQELAVSGNDIFVVWSDSSELGDAGADDDIFFRHSSNGGESWDDIVVVSNEDKESTNPSIALGDKIYLAWLQDDPEDSYDYPYLSSSEDMGESWAEPWAAYRPNKHTNEPYICSNGDKELFLCYDYNMDIFLGYSQDGGESWEKLRTVASDVGSIGTSRISYGKNGPHLSWMDDRDVSWSDQDNDITHQEIIPLKKIFLNFPDHDFFNRTVSFDWELQNFEDGDEIEIFWAQSGELTSIEVVDAFLGSYAWDCSGMNGERYELRLVHTEDNTVVAYSDRFTIDNLAPTTTPELEFDREYTLEETTWGDRVEIKLEGNDEFELDVEGSGVKTIFYRLDSNDWEEYVEEFDILENGMHELEFYALDRMGNQEEEQELEVHIDSRAPELLNWDIPDLDSTSSGVMTVSAFILEEETGYPTDDDRAFGLEYALGTEGDETAHRDWKDLEKVKIEGGHLTGEIDEDWPQNSEDWGDYFLYLRGDVVDHLMNKGTNQTRELVENDREAPEITSLDSSVGEDSDGTYTLGELVKITAQTGEEGLTGYVLISGCMSDGSDFNTSLSAQGSTYSCDWDTTNLEPGNYPISITLVDGVGNSVTDASLTLELEEIKFPELVVEEITVLQDGEDKPIVEKHETQVFVLVKNTGTQDVTAAVLNLYDGHGGTNTLIGTKTFDIPAGDSRNVSLVWAPEAGEEQEEHSIIAIVDPVPGEKETETSNTRETTVKLTLLPDLVVLPASFINKDGVAVSSAEAESEVTITAKVVNTGTIPAECTVKILVSGEELLSTTTTMEPGTKKEFPVAWTPEEKGSFKIEVKVEPTDPAGDRDAQNNQREDSFTVKEASDENNGDGSLPVGILVLAFLLGVSLYRKKNS